MTPANDDAKIGKTKRKKKTKKRLPNTDSGLTRNEANVTIATIRPCMDL